MSVAAEEHFLFQEAGHHVSFTIWFSVETAFCIVFVSSNCKVIMLLFI
jgi:hypothetical protein